MFAPEDMLIEYIVELSEDEGGLEVMYTVATGVLAASVGIVRTP